jgi:hypothetical protein
LDAAAFRTAIGAGTGGGDVSGPASATNNALAAFDGTTGKLIKNASLTANNVLLGNGTGAPLVVAPGTAGNVLSSNGTTWTSAALPAGGLTYIFTTTAVTATDKQGVLTDTSGGAFTVTLPATPSVGAQVVIADAGASWGTNNLTVGRNGSTIGGLAENLICDITGASVQFVYDGTTWEVYAQIGGQGGNAVTLDGVQTLTNKTINIANNTLTGVQPTLVSGTNIKTINGGSVLGSGDLVIASGGMTLLATLTPNGVSTIAATNLAASESLIIVVENISVSQTGFATTINAAMSSDNGSTFSSVWNTAIGTTTGLSGFSQIFRSDVSGSGKMVAIIRSTAAAALSFGSVTGVINALQFTTTAGTFTGTGSIYIYGMN